jgi:hypothetical protein
VTNLLLEACLHAFITELHAQGLEKFMSSWYGIISLLFGRFFELFHCDVYGFLGCRKLGEAADSDTIVLQKFAKAWNVPKGLCKPLLF